MEWFRQAEADLALFEPAIGGYSLWPALRFSAWQVLSGVRTTGAPAKSIAKRRAEKLLGVATYGLWSLAQRQRLRGKSFDLAIITQEAHRLETPRGWWDLYLDDVAAHGSFDGRVLRIERRDFALARRYTVAPRHLFTDLQRLNTKQLGRTEETTVADATCDLLFKRLDNRSFDEQAFRLRARQIARRFHEDL
ncbi:MAG TPA: hypothetical protein VFH33_05730, partial [Candidatus Krumholzibacteria bacterium]|nr:hypothetical protein [Candidatus Krumholzibacteria bacterium]